MRGACDGKNLGAPGYSYDFVARLYEPLLRRWGELISVQDPQADFEIAANRLRSCGCEVVHFCLLPFQDAYLSPTTPNIVVPAWEFPDIPQEEFDENAQNNWVATAERCSAVMVGGPFTADALQAAGVTVPIRIVQVPTPAEYFDVSPWSGREGVTLDCHAEEFPNPRRRADVAAARAAARRAAQSPASPPPPGAFRCAAKGLYHRMIKPWAPKHVHAALTEGVHATIRAWQAARLPPEPRPPAPDYQTSPVELSGVVYTSIFNPFDGRKNWGDILSGFLFALGDCPDATLALKLISSKTEWIEAVAMHLNQLNIAHRCKIVLISDYLSDAQMVALARASTYYLSAAKAEGNGLPLMNYLAAGRPGISPRHSAIADYFNDEIGFVVESHPEPCAFPHDSEFSCRTTWDRVVWPSLVEQIRKSYLMAKFDAAAYHAMAARARRKMLEWCHPQSVAPRLWSALDLACSRPRESSAAAETRRPMAA